jgi:hypothetical protein
MQGSPASGWWVRLQIRWLLRHCKLSFVASVAAIKRPAGVGSYDPFRLRR